MIFQSNVRCLGLFGIIVINWHKKITNIMNPEQDLLRLKRENFRVEIRRKQMEDIFSQKRRGFLQSGKQQQIIEEEKPATSSRPPLSARQYELLQNLIDRNLDDETLREIQEVLGQIEYQLNNGRNIDFLEWAGPIDIVKAVIDAMELYEYRQSAPMAEHASRCLQLLTSYKNKGVRDLVNKNSDKAINIYKEWFIQQHPSLMKDALVGLSKLYTSQDKILNFQVSEDMIDQALAALSSKNTSEPLKRKIYSFLASAVKHIHSEDRLIAILRVAQALFETNDHKSIIRGMRIVENASTFHPDFVLGMRSIKAILDQVLSKSQDQVYLALQIFANLSVIEDEILQQKLLDLGFLTYINTLLVSCKKNEYRKYAGLIFSNMMAWHQPLLSEILEHPISERSLNSMETDTLSIRRELFYAWANFMEVADRSQFIASARLGVLDTAIKAFYEEDPCLLELTLRILLAAFKQTNAQADMEDQLRHFLKSHNIVHHLDRLTRHKAFKVHSLANELINKFYYEYFY